MTTAKPEHHSGYGKRRTEVAPPPVSGSLDAFYAAIRNATHSTQDWERTARSVAGLVSMSLPHLDHVLAAVPVEARAGHDRSQLLHVEPDGSFSVVALLSRPGQATSIHDHTSWCVVALISGTEYEERFRLDPTCDYLTLISTSDQMEGTVTGFAPPGDIHRVTNPDDTLAVSLHIYGTDLHRVTNSVRRTYHQPVRVTGIHGVELGAGDGSRTAAQGLGQKEDQGAAGPARTTSSPHRRKGDDDALEQHHARVVADQWEDHAEHDPGAHHGADDLQGSPAEPVGGDPEERRKAGRDQRPHDRHRAETSQLEDHQGRHHIQHDHA